MIKLGSLIRARQNRGFVIGQLCFFGLGLIYVEFFDSGSLDLYFGNEDSVRKAMASGITNIQVLDHDIRF